MLGEIRLPPRRSDAAREHFHQLFSGREPASPFRENDDVDIDRFAAA
jgi:hypothetical protein